MVDAAVRREGPLSGLSGLFSMPLGSPGHFLIWNRICALPRPFIDQWQIGQLRQAVASAEKHVSFYGRMLSSHGIASSDIWDLESVRRLPVLNKERYRREPLERRTHSELMRKGDYIWNQTSGSTGTPFKYLMSSFYTRHADPAYGRYAELSKYRFLLKEGLSASFIVNAMRVAELGVRYPRPNARFFSIEDFNASPERFLDDLYALAPDVLESSPSLLHVAAEVNNARLGDRVCRVPFLSIHSEALSDADREFLARSFDAEVYCRYGTGELGAIGIECAEHDGFHINEESYLVEVIDGQGVPVPAGAPGRIVVSFFYNEIMPLLRYDTGDEGVLFAAPCRCGLRTKRIRIAGRNNQMTMLQGRPIGVFQFEMLLSEYSDSILRFQIVQKAVDAIEIKVIPTPRFDERSRERLATEFKRMFGISPTIVAVRELSYSARGKTKVFVDESRTQPA